MPIYAPPAFHVTEVTWPESPTLRISSVCIWHHQISGCFNFQVPILGLYHSKHFIIQHSQHFFAQSTFFKKTNSIFLIVMIYYELHIFYIFILSLAPYRVFEERDFCLFLFFVSILFSFHSCKGTQLFTHSLYIVQRPNAI